MLNQKGNFLTPFVILVLIFALGFTVYKFLPQSNKNQPASSDEPLVIPSWQTFTHSDGLYSFQYPPEVAVKQDGSVASIKFPKQPPAINYTAMYIYPDVNSAYNYGLDRYILESYHKSSRNPDPVENLIVNGKQARIIVDHYGPDSLLIVIDNDGIFYEISFYNYGDIEGNRKVLDNMLSSFKFSPVAKEETALKLKDGDIYFNDKKLTDWGYNTSPILSPDGKKIAYISKTEETVERESKPPTGFTPTSRNVWIINTDGSNAIQVTNHEDWVFRGELVWLDNNRLLFTDGQSSVKVYSISGKSTQTVLGPTDPVSACVDACGGNYDFFLSPDNNYLVLLGSESELEEIETTHNQILNTKTLKTIQINNNSFTRPDLATVEFSSNSPTLSVMVTTNQSTGYTPAEINLETGSVSLQ